MNPYSRNEGGPLKIISEQLKNNSMKRSRSNSKAAVGDTSGDRLEEGTSFIETPDGSLTDIKDIS